MSEDQQQQQEEKVYPAPTSAKFATGALLSALPVLAHFGPTGLLLSGVAGFVAYRHGPEVYDLIRNDLSFLPSLEGGKRSEKEPRTPGERSMWARLLGAPALHDEQDEQGQEQGQDELHQDEPGDYWSYDRDDGDELQVDQSMFTFSQLLASGFRPTLHKIFLGRLTDGTDVFVEAKDLCHVALAGSTGNGKSSLLRLIMAQLCYIRVNVVLLNPHYMVYDKDHSEDWTPFTPYLARNPLDYITAERIAFMLKWIIEHTLSQRMQKARQGLSVGKPYFVVIDELPAIVAECKECAGYVAKLLREGRKYGIFLIVASQDFLVKTTGMDAQGGAVRKCFRTACYVGGDITTANVLLEKQEKPIPETDLGKGTMMLRCSATSKAVLASVPYCDNEALYTLLGPSTFRQSKEAPVYEPDALGNAETGVSAPVNDAVNDATGSSEPLPRNERLRLLGNAETPEIEHNEAEEPPVNVNAETRKLIQRMVDMKTYKHREISKIVGLDGRKYDLYKQVCREMGIATERET